MTQFDKIQFAERLHALRTRYGWSQTLLARKAGINLANYNSLEHGRKAGVRADTVMALATALNVSTDYLLGLSAKER